jgi:hypothetical protein
MKKISYALLLGFFALVAQDSFAQIGKRASKEFQRAQSRRIARYSGSKGFAKSNQYWTIGASVGYANYFGDLAPDKSPFSTVYDQATPYLGVFLGKRLSPFLTLKANLGYMRIAADDASVDPKASISNQGRWTRNLSFANDIYEGSVILQADLFPTQMGAIRRNFLNPYGFIGLSVFTNNPKALGPKNTDQADTWVDLRPLKTEGQSTAYGMINVGLPLGIGVRYRVSNNIDIGLELGYRITFTNYLDDVGTAYPSISALQNMSPLARTMSMRSGERYTAATGNDRFSQELFNGPKLSANQYESLYYSDATGTVLPITGIDGRVMNVISGNRGVGQDIISGESRPAGAPRGGSGRDYIFVTGIHLTYILPDNGRGSKGRF